MITKEKLLKEKERILKNIDKRNKRINQINENLKKLEEQSKHNWKPKKGEDYYLIHPFGIIDKTTKNTELDDAIISLGNYFKTEQEALFEVERLKVLAELKEFSYVFSDNEWKSNGIDKYFIGIDPIENTIAINYTTRLKYNDVYFKSREDCKKAIEKIGEERLKKYYFKVGVGND